MMLCATAGSSTSSMFKVQVFRRDLGDTAEELLMAASVSVISHLIFILHCLLITPLWPTVTERKYCGWRGVKGDVIYTVQENRVIQG